MPKQRAQPKAAATRRSNIVTRGAAIADPPPEPRRVTSVQYMSRMVQRAVNTINNKIAELENKISTPSTPVEASDTSIQGSDTNIQALVQPGPSTVYYPVPQMSAEKPKYPSKYKHPVTFIEDLTAYLKKYPGTTDIVDMVLESLDGEVREWGRLYRSRWTQFEDFKRDFLENFWGEAEQGELRRKIVQNTWDGTQSMLSHFISLCGQAKMLTYPIQEQQLVSDIIGHFPRNIQYAWNASNYTTILQATEFLRKLDNVNKRTDLKQKNTRTNVVQKPAAAEQHQPENRNNFNRKRQFNDRPARQATSNRIAKTNVVNIVNDSNNSSNEPTNNLNE